MTVRYHYAVEGTAAAGQTWSATGVVVRDAGDLVGAVRDMLADAFDALTAGRAVYGQPGTTCSGPYVIRKLSITRDDMPPTGGQP